MAWTSQLAADITDSETVVTVTVPLVPSRFSNYVVIDSEVLQVDGAGGGSLTVRRGALGSEPVAHTAGASISRYGTFGTYAPPSGGTAAAHPDLSTHAALGLAVTAHNHDSAYSSAGHAHGTASHGHAFGDLAGAAATGHAHGSAAHGHAFADLSGAAATGHSHGTASHGHAFVDLAGAAATGHNHDASYATSGHSHGTAAHSHADADLPAGLARDAEVTSAIATHAATPHGGSLPAGLIVMWGGLVANIPSGWVLCDGQNGTPDLRAKFIRGATGEPGTAGGTATHSHAGHSNHVFTQPTAAGEAAHTHTYNQVITHTHVQTVNTASTGGLSGYTADTSTNTAGASGYSTQAPAGAVATGTASAGSSHTHTLSGGAVDAHSAHDSVNHEPPYYALCFIQKT